MLRRKGGGGVTGIDSTSSGYAANGEDRDDSRSMFSRNSKSRAPEAPGAAGGVSRAAAIRRVDDKDEDAERRLEREVEMINQLVALDADVAAEVSAGIYAPFLCYCPTEGLMHSSIRGYPGGRQAAAFDCGATAAAAPVAGGGR